jgi:hypothetical protein
MVALQGDSAGLSGQMRVVADTRHSTLSRVGRAVTVPRHVAGGVASREVPTGDGQGR